MQRTFYLLLFFSQVALSCSKKESVEIRSENLNKEEKHFLQSSKHILYLADEVSVDSAAISLEKLAPLKEETFKHYKAKAKFHYLNGYILDYKGQFKSSINSYKKGIALLENSPDSTSIDLALLYNDLGFVYNEVRIVPLRDTFYRKAFQLLATKHPEEEEKLRDFLINTIQTYEDNEPYEAKKTLVKAQKILEKSSETKTQFILKYARAKYLLVFDNELEMSSLLSDLLSSYASLSSQQKTENHSYFLYAIDALGFGFLKQKNYSKGQEAFEHMQKYAIRPYDKMKASSNFSALFLQQKQYKKAAAAYKETLYLLEDENPRDVNRLMLQTARAQMLVRDKSHKESQMVIDQMWTAYFKGSFHADSIKASTFGTQNTNRWHYILTTSAEIYRKAGADPALPRAFAHCAQKLFSGYYSGGIMLNDLAGSAKNIKEELLFAQKSMPKTTIKSLNQIEQLESQFTWNSFLAKYYKQKVQDKTELYFNLSLAESEEEKNRIWDSEWKQLRKENPGLSYLVKKEIDIESVQKELDKNEVFLRYILTEENVWAYALTPDKVDLKLLGNVEEIEEKVNRFLKEIQSRAMVEKTLAGQLLDSLHINATKITILADDFLQKVPFEVLFPTSKVKSLRYISHLNFYKLPEKQIKTTAKMLAIAPTYSGNKEYGELFQNDAEIQVIEQKFQANLLQNEEANSINFKELAPKFSYIHLAMHCTVDSSNYDNSSLVFTDSSISFQEIVEQKIPAELMVLSACNTGIGPAVNGEGLMSIAKAFILAGTRSVVYSLWEISDAETAEMMQNFYHFLQQGLPKDEALWSAKLKFLSDNPLKHHPWYWAGFVLSGDNSPVNFQERNYWVWLASVLALIGMGYFFRKRCFKSSPII